MILQLLSPHDLKACVREVCDYPISGYGLSEDNRVMLLEAPFGMDLDGDTRPDLGAICGDADVVVSRDYGFEKPAEVLAGTSTHTAGPCNIVVWRTLHFLTNAS